MFSSDLVFDGMKGEPYVESDPVCPSSAYGESKAEAERRVLEILPTTLIIRSGPWFGTWDEHDVVTDALRTLALGQTPAAVADQTISPTYVPDLVSNCLDLLIYENTYRLHAFRNDGANRIRSGIA